MNLRISYLLCHKTLDSIFNSGAKCPNARTLATFAWAVLACWWVHTKKQATWAVTPFPSPPHTQHPDSLWVRLVHNHFGFWAVRRRLIGGPLWHFASFLAIFKQFNLILLVLAKLKQLGRNNKKATNNNKKVSPTVTRHAEPFVSLCRGHKIGKWSAQPTHTNTHRHREIEDIFISMSFVMLLIGLVYFWPILSVFFAFDSDRIWHTRPSIRRACHISFES